MVQQSHNSHSMAAHRGRGFGKPQQSSKESPEAQAELHEAALPDVSKAAYQRLPTSKTDILAELSRLSEKGDVLTVAESEKIERLSERLVFYGTIGAERAEEFFTALEALLSHSSPQASKTAMKDFESARFDDECFTDQLLVIAEQVLPWERELLRVVASSHINPRAETYFSEILLSEDSSNHVLAVSTLREHPTLGATKALLQSWRSRDHDDPIRDRIADALASPKDEQAVLFLLETCLRGENEEVIFPALMAQPGDGPQRIIKSYITSEDPDKFHLATKHFERIPASEQLAVLAELASSPVSFHPVFALNKLQSMKGPEAAVALLGALWSKDRKVSLHARKILTKRKFDNAVRLSLFARRFMPWARGLFAPNVPSSSENETFSSGK